MRPMQVNTKPRVVVVGSANTDMVARAARLPRPGETLLGGEFVMAAGGKGANQAVAAARLGAEVTLVARIGSDMFGDACEEGFRKEGIDTQYVLRDEKAHSGVALILVGQEGENQIVVAPGSNMRLTPGDVERALPAFEGAQVVVAQLEIPMEAVERAGELAKECGAAFILNPAPAAPISDKLAGHIDILIPNESELEILGGKGAHSMKEAVEGAHILLDRGIGRVVVTLGASGALLVSSVDSRHVPGYEVAAVDSTAAGDCFIGALAKAVADGVDIVEAVRYANRAASISVTRVGAQPSLPYAAEVEEYS
jgi:ribokinase